EAAGGGWAFTPILLGGVWTYSDNPLADRVDGNYWGLGLVQRIDAAAVDLFINYRHYELDGGAQTQHTVVPGFLQGCGGPCTQTATAADRDVDVIQAGMRIQF